MNFSEVLAEVLRITKRPDKSAEASFQINRAISFYTMKVNWTNDFVEFTLSVDPTLYGQVVDISSLTRFRKFKYIKPTGERYYLTTAGADQIFIPGGQIQPNKYFVGGSSLTITLSKLTSTLEVGYYTYPLTLSGIDTHWMLDMMPYAIIEKAAARIFQSAGDDASAKMYESTATEFFVAARNDFEDGAVSSAS